MVGNFYDGTLQRLISMMDTPPMGVLGVSTCNDTEPWKYYIAVSTSQEKNELEEYIVPAAAWAIFLERVQISLFRN